MCNVPECVPGRSRLMQHFDFHEIFKTKQTAFAPDARLFIAAKRASRTGEGR